MIQWYWQLLTGVKLSQQQLVILIESTPGVYMDPPGSKKLNFRAVLEEPPLSWRGFVQEEDHSIQELVTDEVWEEIKSHLLRGGWPKTTDTTIRSVTVACWLQDQSDILCDISFGRLLQIITICTHQDKYLGVRDGCLVPYHESEEFERLQNADAGKPTGVRLDEDYIKSWEELTECLRQLIVMSPKYEVEVSQVKLQCRGRLQKELSETVFGHCTLSKLLDDERLAADFVKSGDPMTRPCISLPRHHWSLVKQWEKQWDREWGGRWPGQDKSDSGSARDSGKDSWGGYKSKGKGAGKILAKALNKGDGKGKDKGWKSGGWHSASASDTASVGGDADVCIEADITLKSGSIAKLKVYTNEKPSAAAKRFLEVESLDPWYQTPLSAWVQKEAAQKEGTFVKLEGDLQSIVKPRAS